jgi:hypothetical protein
MNTENEYDSTIKLMLEFSKNYLTPIKIKALMTDATRQETDCVFYDIFNGFTEIMSALENLSLMETLLYLKPPRSKRVDKSVYINLLISSYLQEMYRFEERLIGYATKLSRLYKIRELLTQVGKISFSALQGLRQTRNAHVHQKSYSDDVLREVSTYALFRKANVELGQHLELKYEAAQVEWGERIRKNNLATRQIVDLFCRIIKPVICKNGTISFP